MPATKPRLSWSERFLAAVLAGSLLAVPSQEAWAAGADRHKHAGKPSKARVAAKKSPKVGKPAIGTADILAGEPGVRGRASFYAHGFQGRRTALGDRFDVRGFTAASNRFPLGSWVMVRRLDGDRCVAVRINDRMGTSHGRVIDLSLAAAQALGMVSAGVALVSVVPIAARSAGRVSDEQCRGVAAGEQDRDCPACADGEVTPLRLQGGAGLGSFPGAGD